MLELNIRVRVPVYSYSSSLTVPESLQGWRRDYYKSNSTTCPCLSEGISYLSHQIDKENRWWDWMKRSCGEEGGRSSGMVDFGPSRLRPVTNLGAHASKISASRLPMFRKNFRGTATQITT